MTASGTTAAPRWRPALAVTFAAIMLVWPVVHILLSQFGEINSWKLGGWGMYASTEPYDFKLTVLWMNRGAALPADLGTLLGPTRFTAVTRGGLRTLPAKAVPAADLKVLGKLSQYLRVTHSRDKMHRFVTGMGKIVQANLGVDPAYALLFLTERRIDPPRRLVYVDTAVFLDTAGGAEKIGTFSSSEMTAEQLHAALLRHLPPGT